MQPAEWKPQSQKVRWNEKEEGYVLDKGTRQNPTNTNEVEAGNLPEKEFRIMIVKMIQDLGKRMEGRIEKMQEMFNKDLEELNRDKQYNNWNEKHTRSNQ